MRILITNDDGVNARGLRLLESVARRFSDDIWIVAPTEEQSGAGHSLTLTTPVRLRRHDDRRFSVTGTPTDAVMLALAHIMKDAPPDVILSGINAVAAASGCPITAASESANGPFRAVMIITGPGWGRWSRRPAIRPISRPWPTVMSRSARYPSTSPTQHRSRRCTASSRWSRNART